MEIKKGGVISFRLPHDTSIEILNYLNNLKNTTGRTFSSRILQIFLNGLANEHQDTKNDYIIFKIPKEFPYEKKKWLQSKETQQYILTVLTQPFAISTIPTIATETLIMENSQDKIPNETASFIYNNFINFDD